MATHHRVPRPASSSSALREFERVYSAELAFVWRVLRRFGVPPEQLEDAAQDVFLVWVRRRDELVRGGSVRTCLYGIARRVAADARRSAARAERRTAALAAVTHDHDEGFERAVETQDAMAAVDRVLPQLSEIQREAYLLAEVEGMSAREIGAALGISPNTASSRLRLARQQLALALGERRLATEEPPAEVRQRVWVALLPLWKTTATGASSKVWIAAACIGLGLLAVYPATRSASANVRGEPAARAEPKASSPRAVGKAAAEAAMESERPRLEAAPVEPPPARPDPRPGLEPRRVTPGSTPAPTAPRPRSASPARPGPDQAPAPAPSEDPLAREARQIAAARRLLKEGRIDAALALLDAHADEALHGHLADEREALRASARCQRGEREAALSDLSAWFGRRSDAPALAAARASCKVEQTFDEQ